LSFHGSFQAWNFEFRVISEVAFFQILFLWLFYFLKFNNPDRGMEVEPAIKIIEVCLYLLALFPGKDWGTSLILSLLASSRSLDKVIGNVFERQVVLVSSPAFSLSEMPLIWLIWIGLLLTLLSIISHNRRHSTNKRFWGSPAQDWFLFFWKGMFSYVN